MILNKRISLVIPCKNEEKIIGRTVESVPSYVDEIIVVDNGSTDNSSQVAKEAGAIVISEPRKLNGIGYGYAHLSGIKKATGDYIFGMDADDTYPSFEIEHIVRYMVKNNIDVVSCSRLPLKNPEAISKTRRLGINVLNFVVLVLYGRRVKDILTGMWGIKTDVLPKLNLRMGDWNLSPEVKVSAITNKAVRFSEYPIYHFVREKEPSKQKIWVTGMNHMFYIIKRRFTDDSTIGGWIYSILLKRGWKRPAFSGSKFMFLV